jgi:hypothetical protein
MSLSMNVAHRNVLLSSMTSIYPHHRSSIIIIIDHHHRRPFRQNLTLSIHSLRSTLKASSSTLMAVWQQCNELVPPLVTPLRAILYMLGLVFVPHLLRVPMYVSTKGCYDNLHSRDQAEGEKLKGNPLGRYGRGSYGSTHD